jgi:hypothetical protein
MKDGTTKERHQHGDLVRVQFFDSDDKQIKSHADCVTWLLWPQDSPLFSRFKGPDVISLKILGMFLTATGITVIVMALNEMLTETWGKLVVFIALGLCGSQLFFYALHSVAWTFAEQRARAARTKDLRDGLRSMGLKLTVVQVPPAATGSLTNETTGAVEGGVNWPSKVLFDLRAEGVEVVHLETRKRVTLWGWAIIEEWGHTEAKHRRQKDHLYVTIKNVGEFGFECSHGKSADVLEAISYFLDENDNHGVTGMKTQTANTLNNAKALTGMAVGMGVGLAGKGVGLVGQTWIGTKVGKAANVVGGVVSVLGENTGATQAMTQARDKAEEVAESVKTKAKAKALQAGKIAAAETTKLADKAYTKASEAGNVALKAGLAGGELTKILEEHPSFATGTRETLYNERAALVTIAGSVLKKYRFHLLKGPDWVSRVY